MSSFSFPFKSNNNNKTSPASMQEFFNALGMETDGFYPFGVNEFWHGGVHVTSKSSGALKQGDGVRCIAEGKVVAYRINEKYIDTPAYEDPTKGTSINIPYSSSFTLVRHKLEYPAKSGNILHVFSLYMHLLPWSDYEKDTNKNIPAYFGKVNYKVGQRAKDKTPFASTTLGANARLTSSGKSLVVSRIPQGSLLELEKDAKKGKRAEIKRIINGTPIKNPDIPEFGYVYIPDLEKLPPSPTGANAGKPIYKVKNTTTDTETFATGVVGTRARLYKNKKSSQNPVLHLIPKGAELILEDNAGTTGRAKIVSIKTGSPTKNPIFNTLGTVWVNDLDKVSKPASFDDVVTLTKPKTIHKGDLIGYMGNNGTPEKQTGIPMLHWEVFAGEELNVFITKARAHNSKAKKSEKTVLKIPKGLKLYSLQPSTKAETLTKETAVKVLEKKGDYIKIETLGLVATTSNTTLGKYDLASNSYAIKTDGLTSINGVTLTGRLTLLKSYRKVSEMSDKTLRAVLSPQNAGKTGWIKKQKLPKLYKITTQYIENATDFWNDYPVSLNENGLKTDHEACYKTSNILKKWTDDKDVEWYEIMFDQHVPWHKKGYINSTKITHHAPEEFICFDVVDVPSEGDGSYHLDPDKHYKTLFEPKTMEASKNEEETPISIFNLQLKPFAKKVFQFLDDNHDGTITLAEIQYALSDPIKQKKLGTLVTKHESEWVESMDRWKHIEKYIPDETRFDWDYEKAKIQKLAWWDEVKKASIENFPTGNAFYFHPAGFVGNFLGGGCTEDLTVGQLKIIDKHTSSKNREKHINGLNETFKVFEINTCLRKIHFLAQVIHESAHLRATKEYDGANASYAPYFGRGLMQLTHKSNYKSYGNYIGIDVYSTDSNRKKLESDPHAAKSAGWYWGVKAKLNDEADSNDFLAVTYKVNGGFNGYKDRFRILKNAIKVFNLEDTVSSNFSFKESWTYNNYKASLAWGMWHDSGSNKYKTKHCDASNAEAKKGYKRFLKLIETKNITFPRTRSNGKTIYYYGHSNPKTYAEERLKLL